MMRYLSTRGGALQDFETVLLQGLAPDGGLYMPDTWPQIDIKELAGKSYADIAEAVIYPFVEGRIERAALRTMIADTYNAHVFGSDAIAPRVEIKPGLHVLELFHGPTLAFKDFALQLLGRLFDHVLEKRGQNITIVGATSGDTGSAAIEGCRHSQHATIFILHPHGRVSEVQRRQMTTVDSPNVHNIAIEGTFDDCQGLVKGLFNDAAFRARMNLSAVNSINWARVMAQIVYYAQTAAALDDASFVVPTGNFGNVLAGYAARRMGVRMNALVIATNRNDILTRFFETGAMTAEGVTPTISPSMDIQISSNFERYLFELLGRNAPHVCNLMTAFSSAGHYALDARDLTKARQDFAAFRCDEAQTMATMKTIYAGTGYTLDPHSAVGMAAALKLHERGAAPVVALATAHPAKFPDAVERATGLRPSLPAHLAGLMDREEVFTVMKNDLPALRDHIAARRGPTIG